MTITKNRKYLFLLLSILSLMLISVGCGGGGSSSSNPGGGGGGGGGGLIAQSAGPTFDRSSGYFVNTTSMDVVITSETSGATLKYTRDSSTPACNAGTTYTSPTTVTISSTTTAIKSVSCKSGYSDSPVSTAGTFTEVTPTVNVNPLSSSTPLADALLIASDGDIVNVPAGIYTEGLTTLAINNNIIFIGAGSGSDPASNTIIANSSSNSHVIGLYNGGTSEANRLEIRNMRIVNGVGSGGNQGTGIMITTSHGHLLFDNIVVTDNDGYGIGFNGTIVDMDDIVITNSKISNNGSVGFKIPSGDWGVKGLKIDNTIFNGNASAGIYSWMEGTNADMYITNSTFYNNASGVHQLADIYVYKLSGTLTISDSTIISNSSESGIRISGGSNGSIGAIAANNMTFTNLTISGTQQKILTYPSGAFVITRYTGLANLVMSNVVFSSTAPSGLFLGTITPGAAPDLGNLEIGVGYANAITLGTHGNSGSYTPTNISIDATGVTFVNAASNAAIEAIAWHSVDDGTLGTVSWTTP